MTGSFVTPQPGLRQRAEAVAQVLVADLDHPELSDEDRHHVAKVLRARKGEHVALVDGSGRWRMSIWDGGSVVEAGDIQSDEQPTPELTVGFALTKRDKPELVVQKLTEIGVDAIQPFVAEHTIVKWDASKRDDAQRRFEKVAYEAAMQSRRTRVPVVHAVVPFTELSVSNCVLAEAGGEQLSGEHTNVLIGPEGGWSPGELESARATVDLGSTVLRAETAAMVAAIKLVDIRAKRTFRS